MCLDAHRVQRWAPRNVSLCLKSESLTLRWRIILNSNCSLRIRSLETRSLQEIPRSLPHCRCYLTYLLRSECWRLYRRHILIEWVLSARLWGWLSLNQRFQVMSSEHRINRFIIRCYVQVRIPNPVPLYFLLLGVCESEPWRKYDGLWLLLLMGLEFCV
jgi:hypothetical protein